MGTEQKLVARLAEQNPGKEIVSLKEGGAVCEDMDLISLRHLLMTLEGAISGRPTGEVSVSDVTARDARLAIERMFELV